MADIPNSSTTANDVEIGSRKPLTEALMSKFGGVINFLLANVGGVNLNQDTFSANGTWNAPADLLGNFVICFGWGGGGGGGGDNGGGGGGSGPVWRFFGSITPGNPYAVVIGAGGAGGISTGDGSDGGNTTFNGVIVGSGARGGNRAGDSEGGLSNGIGGNGGRGAETDPMFYNGQNSPYAIGGTGRFNASGAGGAGFGNGGASGASGVAGSPGVNGGGGGAGGGAFANGGAGGGGGLYVFYLTKKTV